MNIQKEVKVGKQVETERGLIWVEGEYNSAEKAKEDGYSFSFHSRKLNCDLYSRIVDGNINKRAFVIVSEN